MAKVLLLNPTQTGNTGYYIPYALLFLQSTLEARGHTVLISDFQMGGQEIQRFKGLLLHKPDILGISLFCGPGVELALEAASLCRRLSPQTTIIWGGILPSISPELILRDAEADYVVRYEGDEALPGLIEALERGDRHPTIPNIAYLIYDEIQLQPRGPLLDMSKLIPIRFDDVNNERYIIKNSPIGSRALSIFTSKGCDYKCSFCYNMAYNRREWRCFPLQMVLDTVDKLIKMFNVDALYIFDDDFFIDFNRAIEIFEGVKKRGHNIKWWAEIRADQVLSLSISELNAYYDLGLREVYISPESGSNRILDILSKGFTVEEVLMANNLLAQTKLLPLYSFMIGIPSETLNETLQTIDLAVKLRESNPRVSVWQINNYIPYPGTSLYKIAVQKHGLMPFAKLSDWYNNFSSRPNKMHWSTLSRSKLQCIGYASMFQKSDSYLSIQPFFSRMVYKIYRYIFSFRLRNHIFTQFFDVWSVIAFAEILFTLNKKKLRKPMKFKTKKDNTLVI